MFKTLLFRWKWYYDVNTIYEALWMNMLSDVYSNEFKNHTG